MFTNFDWEPVGPVLESNYDDRPKNKFQAMQEKFAKAVAAAAAAQAARAAETAPVSETAPGTTPFIPAAFRKRASASKQTQQF